MDEKTTGPTEWDGVSPRPLEPLTGEKRAEAEKNLAALRWLQLAHERRSALENAVEKWSGWTDHGGQGAEDRTTAVMKFADLVDEHPRASELIEVLRAVAATKPAAELDPTLNSEQKRIIGVALEDFAAGGTGTVSLQAWANEQTADLRAGIARAMATPEPAVRSRTVEEQALATDLEDLLPQLRDVAGVLAYRANWLARMLVDRGWVLAARGRVEGAPTKLTALQPGQLVREWGVTDRVEEDGIRFGVDGPIGYPLRLVVEDGELRLRQDRSAEPKTPDEEADRG